MQFFSRTQKRIYLDHAAATPLRPEVAAAMRPYFTQCYANPSAIHAEGRAARAAVEDARLSVARTLGVRATDITFTSGGTESNNIALTGHVAALRKSGISSDAIEIIATRTEHPSISQTLAALAEAGCTVTYVPVDTEGRLDMTAFEAALSAQTRLVTVAYANSETGVIQDIAHISRSIKKHNAQAGTQIVLHTDASQAPLWLSCTLEQVRADLMTLDAGKFGGPKGVGILVHRSPAALAPVMHGGSQENGLRPGTENVPLIIGCAKALEYAQAAWRERATRVAAVRDYGIAALTKLNGVVLNGNTHERIANNINISIPGLDTEFAVVTLDSKGIACSTKSACSGAGSGRSEVVYAMTKDAARAAATIRLTLGEETTTKDMDRVTAIVGEYIHKMLIYSAVQ